MSHNKFKRNNFCSLVNAIVVFEWRRQQGAKSVSSMVWQRWAKGIKVVFPLESESAYFSHLSGSKEPRGKLYSRYHAYRFELRKSGLLASAASVRTLASSPSGSRSESPSASTSTSSQQQPRKRKRLGERVEASPNKENTQEEDEALLWLHSSWEPRDVAELFWKKTSKARRRLLLRDPDLSAEKYLNRYKAATTALGYQLVSNNVALDPPQTVDFLSADSLVGLLISMKMYAGYITTIRYRPINSLMGYAIAFKLINRQIIGRLLISMALFHARTPPDCYRPTRSIVDNSLRALARDSCIYVDSSQV